MAGEPITVDAENVKRLLKRLSDRLESPRPVLMEMGEIGHARIVDNFQQESGGGKDWPDLKEATKKARARKGKWPGKMLQVTGAGGLIGSINYKTGSAKGNPSVTWGTSKIYAATHHFGDKSRGIPARPFMVLDDGALKEMEEALRDWLIQ